MMLQQYWSFHCREREFAMFAHHKQQQEEEEDSLVAGRQAVHCRQRDIVIIICLPPRLKSEINAHFLHPTGYVR